MTPARRGLQAGEDMQVRLASSWQNEREMTVKMEFADGLYTFWKLVDSKTGSASVVRVRKDSTIEDRIARLKTDKSSAGTEHAVIADTHDQRLEASQHDAELWIQTHPTDVPVGRPPPSYGVAKMRDGPKVVLAIFTNGRISVRDEAANVWQPVEVAKITK